MKYVILEHHDELVLILKNYTEQMEIIQECAQTEGESLKHNYESAIEQLSELGMSKQEAHAMLGSKHPGGRPAGPKMPCGWCKKPMTASEIRKHFTECPKRPKN